MAELKIEKGVLYATPVDGYVYTEEAADKNKEPKSYTQSEKTPLILYTTALNDASLLPLLEEHNVNTPAPSNPDESHSGVHDRLYPAGDRHGGPVPCW